jgi:hypothetical protein
VTLDERRPNAIHFSGHGLRPEDIRSELESKQLVKVSCQKPGCDSHNKIVAKGGALVMETPDCLACYLHEDDLEI